MLFSLITNGEEGSAFFFFLLWHPPLNETFQTMGQEDQDLG